LEVNNPREKGKKLLSSLRDLEQKKLLVNSKKLTLKKDFSKEEKNVCQKKLLSFQTKRRCFSKKKKTKEFFCQILQTYNKNCYVNKSNLT